MRRAFSAVRNGRPRPAVVEIPGDVFPEEIENLSYTPVKTARSAPDPADVAKAAEMQLAAANPKFRGGFYISLSESRCGGLRELRDAGYDFYTHRDESDQVIPKSVADKLAGTNAVKGTLPEPELVYKRWVGEHNAIPAWATSIEGAAALIFSPPSGNDPHAPGDDLLLVWEQVVQAEVL